MVTHTKAGICIFYLDIMPDFAFLRRNREKKQMFCPFLEPLQRDKNNTRKIDQPKMKYSKNIHPHTKSHH